jgi:hypothetical protein
MKKMKTFFLKITLYSDFWTVKQYLMKKYRVYTAIFIPGQCEFRICTVNS